MNARGAPAAGAGERTVRTRGGGSEPLLDAALAVVEARGVDALTVRAVATEAGVSPGTVSYHFTTSDELLERALEHGSSQIAVLLERLATDLLDEGWDAAEWPGMFAKALAADLDARRAQHLACIELHMLAARRPELRPSAERIQLAYARVAYTIVRAMGIPEPEQTVVGLVALTSGLMLKELTTPAPGAEHRLRAVFENVAAAYRPA